MASSSAPVPSPAEASAGEPGSCLRVVSTVAVVPNEARVPASLRRISSLRSPLVRIACAASPEAPALFSADGCRIGASVLAGLGGTAAGFTGSSDVAKEAGGLASEGCTDLCALRQAKYARAETKTTSAIAAYMRKDPGEREASISSSSG